MLIIHDPQATLDYRWDWTAWLDGDTITAATVTTPDASLTITDVTRDDTTVSAWITGGTTGTTAHVRCHITTAGGRQDDRTINLRVRDR